jgi:hypothetical protein
MRALHDGSRACVCRTRIWNRGPSVAHRAGPESAAPPGASRGRRVHPWPYRPIVNPHKSKQERSTPLVCCGRQAMALGGSVANQWVEDYFSELRDIRAMGGAVAEISYYPAVRQLLDEVGKHLKPKVRAIMQLANAGAGNPDGGLFTANQWGLVAETLDPLSGQIPARGAIEVKGACDDAFTTARSAQVAKYAERYGLVLVTNLRDWVLVRWEDGEVRELEHCRLCETEAGFWAKVAKPRAFAEASGEGLTEFLKRVMLQNAPLAGPKDLAWFLASYARTARLRLEHKRELPALDQLRGQLEDALGLKFEGEKGDHFFRSTLVQTLFYGVFAAWVLASEDGEPRAFEWKRAADTLDVPFISALFYQFANPALLGPLGIAEVLEWAEDALNRVERAAFFERFKKEHAVQYFYEPFLEAFDPQLRKELGVWYTPDEVVRYMVARVDWALREELGIEDGLADESVYVLDPCCGTGAYLVEVLRTINRTLEAKGADGLTSGDIKRAAMKRVIGFEIMPAPFVIAHLQLGLLLAELGVPLAHVHGEHERAAVYLTNALTGWDSADPSDPGAPGKKVSVGQLLLEFETERDAAAKVKREAPILVVIGNPPYNAFGGTSPAEEEGLVEPYKEGLVKQWGVKKFNLDDPYVRFFRLAERTIAERGGQGVVAFISNFSYTSEASFVVMRQRLMQEFDGIWVDNLNGDSRETGKKTPDGLPDPSVFSTPQNRAGIRVGTAVGLLVRRQSHQAGDRATTRYREFWGAGKRADLVDGTRLSSLEYQTTAPAASNGFSLRPSSVSDQYLSWPKVKDLASHGPLNGPVERRGNALISLDRDVLVLRMRAYFDPSVSDDDVAALHPSLMMTGNRIVGPAARKRLLGQTRFDDAKIVPYMFKPFDLRWCYLDNIRPLFSEPSPDLIAQQGSGARFFVTRNAADKVDEGVPFLWSTAVCDYHSLDGEARHFPVSFRGRESGPTQPLFERDGDNAGNVSERAAAYMTAVGGGAEELWLHALAVGFAPRYLLENHDGVRNDWPRIPLPRDARHFHLSASLGRRVAALLDVAGEGISQSEKPVRLGTLRSAAGGALDESCDLGLTVRWGIGQAGGVVMPSTGRLTERPYSDDERGSIRETAEVLGLPEGEAIALLGETCFDVWLNDVAYWRCVPANVWLYTVGGYQVIKKWLSYRERSLLGRDLKPDEARHVADMVRRISALILLQPELDASYGRMKADVWEWSA